ncbi:MAG: hypothetical protein WCR06_04380, partial [bacterium]
LFGGGFDVPTGFCHASPMRSLLQTGFGMFSARADRGRPGDAEKCQKAISYQLIVSLSNDWGAPQGAGGTEEKC